MSEIGIKTFQGINARDVEDEFKYWSRVNDHLDVINVTTGFVDGKIVIIVTYEWRY